MADVSAFESPQQVQARLQALRQQQLAPTPFLGMQQALIGQGMDAIFGNPEVKKAKLIQDKVESAVAGLPVDADEITREMTRLQAARDAFVEAKDLGTASKINMQILALKTAQMEQRKLTGEVEGAEAERLRQKELHPLEVQKAVGEGNEYENWVDPKTGKHQAVHETDLVTKDGLAKRGYVLEGKLNLQGTPAEMFGLNKPVVTDLQTSLIEANAQLTNLRGVANLYNPRFTQLPTQVLTAGMNALERLGATVPANQKDDLAQYHKWRAATLDNANRYVKYITGAQMSQYEIQRILQVVPTPDDGDTKFMSKLRNMTRMGLQAQKRAEVALRNGLTELTGEQLAGQLGGLEQFDVSEAEVNTVLGLPSPTDRDGWQTINGVRVRKVR